MTVLSAQRMRRLAVAAALSGAVAASGALAGCSTTGSRAAIGGFTSGNSLVVLVPADQRKIAPILAGTLLDGQHASTASAKGKVTVINHWSSWCGPCRSEEPGLAAAARALPGVAFFGIDTRDDKGSAQAFVQSHEIPYPSFFDQDGNLLLQLQQVANISALPSTVFIDKEGRVAAYIAGETDQLTVEQEARTLEHEK